jgi:cobalt-zinc-cadmium efflux system membrane fusion protein
MFRVADLSVLAAWVHPLEEYLPVLSRLAERHDPRGLYWQLRLQAEAGHAPLAGPILRIAPSVDPTQRTLLVMGQVANPQGRLLAGQAITATIFVRPAPGLVEVATAALNEERGQSIVFVQPDPNKLEFVQRRVAVAARFVDVVLVRSKLTPEDERLSQAGAENRLQAIRPLQPGERVVTQGVPMLTFALRDLLAKEALSAR